MQPHRTNTTVPATSPRFLQVLGVVALSALAACAGPASPASNPPATAPSGIATAPRATAQPAPTSALPLGLADVARPLAAGTYLIGEPYGIPLTVTVPDGWLIGHLDQGEVSLNKGNGWIVVDLVENVFADPCRSETGPAQPPVAATVDAIVAALTGMKGFEAEHLADLEVGSHRGKSFELTNFINVRREACYGIDRLPMWTYRGGTEAWTVSGLRERMWVLDVDGTPVVVDRGGPGVDEIAASMRFGAPRPWTPPAPTPEPSGPRLHYVALGDSLLFAAEEDCDGCTSAAVIYGRQMAIDLGIPVEVHNLTMHNSLTSSDLLGYFEHGVKIGREPEDLFAALRRADVISVTIGFNDAGSVEALAANLDGILQHIGSLREGRPTAIRVTQLYNNGGAVFLPKTEAANAATCEVATRHHAICVDIFHPFNGPDGTADPIALGYLGADQTHPSQRGMEVIAQALTEAGYAPLR